MSSNPPSDLAGERRLDGVRLCVLDVDGTLLGSDHHVSADTRDAVDEAVAAGLELMLATSRGACALSPVLDEVPALRERPFVASQGAVLGRYAAPGRLALLAHRPAPVDAAREVVEQAGRLGLSISWYAQDRWLVPLVDAAIRREAALTRVAPTLASLDGLTAGPDKLMLVGDRARLAGIAETLPPSLHAQFSHPTYLEITAAGVDKATALSAYFSERGLDPDAVLAVGDGLNDLGMFALAGITAAPANAEARVRTAADLTLPSNDDGAVAALLRAITAGRTR